MGAKKTYRTGFCMIGCMVLYAACWDEIEHQLKPDGGGSSDTGVDSDTTDTALEWIIPDDWKGFGTSCQSEADCTGYVATEKRCVHTVVGMINTPGGYCTSCCNEPGVNVCAPGIDCVGYLGIYLVCLAHCNSDADCRQDEGYECRPIYYIPDQFKGDYCLPAEEFVEPTEPDAGVDDALCPWPWLS